MNRTVWVARFVALMILIVFALVMANLHRQLTRMQQSQPPAQTTT